MLEKTLEEIGLSDKEAAIYLFLQTVDSATATKIAQATKLKRPTTYVVLEQLEKMGLVSEVTTEKVVQFRAEPPERLLTFVERRKLELEERARRLESDIIPQIKSLQRGSGEKPVVKYFEGRSGALSAVDEFYVSAEPNKGDVYLIYPRDLLRETFPDKERIKYKNIRLKKKLKAKVIYTQQYGDQPSDENAQRLKIDGEKYPIYCDIGIYQDKVRISTLGNRVSGIFIRSKDLAESLRSLIDLIYDLRNEKK
jgi:sugar-specific transcriptional regulator TrmB